MQTPQRKLGKYSHLKPDPKLTAEKYRDLKKNLERLKKIQPSAADEVKRLASDGDFSENAAYQQAKGRLRGILNRINEIEDHLKRAEIIEAPADKSRVRIGHSVTIGNKNRVKTYTILGSSETNPSSGVISYTSPLGAALIGKKIGDHINVRDIEYEIMSIE